MSDGILDRAKAILQLRVSDKDIYHDAARVAKALLDSVKALRLAREALDGIYKLELHPADVKEVVDALDKFGETLA